MLDPDDRDLLTPGLVDEAADVRDDGVAIIPLTLPFCTSTTTSAVFGRFLSVVIVSLVVRSLAECEAVGLDAGLGEADLDVRSVIDPGSRTS